MKDPNEKGGGGKKGSKKNGENKKNLIYNDDPDDISISYSADFRHYLIGEFNNAIVGNTGLVTGSNLEHDYSRGSDSSFTGDLQEGTINEKQLELDDFYAGARINGEFDSEVFDEGKPHESVECIHLNNGTVRFPTGLLATCNNANKIYLTNPDDQERIFLLFRFNGRRILTFLDGMNPGHIVNFTGDLKLRLNRNLTVTLLEGVDYRRLTNDQAYYNQIVGEVDKKIQEYKMKMIGVKRDKPDRGNGKGGDKGGKGGGAGAVSGLNTLNTKMVKVK